MFFVCLFAFVFVLFLGGFLLVVVFVVLLIFESVNSCTKLMTYVISV